MEIINERVATNLQTADFYYDLPEELIAQTPMQKRSESRLLVVDREKDTLAHRRFENIIEYLRPEDILVVNSSKVIPARLLGVSAKTGSPVELLLLRMGEDGTWECLVRPGKRAKVGARITFGEEMEAEVLDVVEEGNRIVRLSYDTARFASVYEALDVVGNMPLPPYITQKLEDKSRYQTVYAKEIGSAAAPTAGLHFTEELLAAIKAKGVGYAEVTLHVGLGTFRPVKETKIENHIMHKEHFHIDAATAALINERKAKGGRIIAVGTTSCRVLESVADEKGVIHACEAETGIFI